MNKWIHLGNAILRIANVLKITFKQADSYKIILVLIINELIEVKTDLFEV